MRIENHRLHGDGITHKTSPNAGGPFAPGAPDTLVLHFTAGDTHDWAVQTLCDPTPGGRVSSHLVIARDGTLTQLLPFDTIAWHAGRSSWGGRTEFNNFSLGIEIDNAGRLTPAGGQLLSWQGTPYDADAAIQATHHNETEPSWWHQYPPRQLERVTDVCRILLSTYGIGWILGHDEISPGRKDDPGPAFPLDELRRVLLSSPLAAYGDVDGADTGVGPAPI